jgi:hypothetical protein
MYHNLGQENDTEVIIFCQIVLGVTAIGVGLVFSMLARLDAVAPAWVMLILSGYALIHARRGPRVPHRGDRPRPCTQQPWTSLRWIPLVIEP